jgi:hypothetical protein
MFLAYGGKDEIVHLPRSGGQQRRRCSSLERGSHGSDQEPQQRPARLTARPSHRQ